MPTYTYNKLTAKPRWTVDEVEEFCGWDFLNKLIGVLSSERNQALGAASFLTGDRNAEALMLKGKHFVFDEDPNFAIAKTIPRVKCYKKTGGTIKWKCDGHCKMRWLEAPTNTGAHIPIKYHGWKTEPILKFRTVPFPKNEPLVSILQGYLKKQGDPEAILFDISYQRAYAIFTKAGKALGVHIPTHWFRAQRASQLAFEYGFNEHDLVEFFKWQDYKTAFHYASKGYKGLAAKMVRV
jgi:hypothetical protein